MCAWSSEAGMPSDRRTLSIHTRTTLCDWHIRITVVACTVFTFTLPVYIYSLLHCKLCLSHTHKVLRV